MSNHTPILHKMSVTRIIEELTDGTTRFDGYAQDSEGVVYEWFTDRFGALIAVDERDRPAPFLVRKDLEQVLGHGILEVWHAAAERVMTFDGKIMMVF